MGGPTPAIIPFALSDMLFNSIDFALFFPLVFLTYWLFENRTTQNVVILISSCIFYGWWDYRFLALLGFSTVLDYVMGLLIGAAEDARAKKVWLSISIVANLGFLGFFKYHNFFAESLNSLMQKAGLQPSLRTLELILPVGISFYTFHGLSYVFDVYRKKINPTVNLLDYSIFVTFFPLLVAGPIERANHLLPQVQNPRRFDRRKATDGLRQILWGLFKKIVIADGCAQIANLVFDHPADYSGSTLLLGAVLFAFQIYGDFSGYSDIALGTARLLGFELLRNFAFPYFSRDIAEFWRRWHISLSSWFRDYLYIPMGGSRGTVARTVFNTFAMFLVSGFWHGANWTFLVWGLLNAAYFLPLLLTKRNRTNLDTVAKGRLLPSPVEAAQMVATFLLIVLAWVFFRARRLHDAFFFLSRIFSRSLFHRVEVVPTGLLLLITVFVIVEWLGRERKYALEHAMLDWPRTARWSGYYVLILCIYFFGSFAQRLEFIYFQF
jgi:D-alanyl-lipoteichoic acid acyltransferase DltB (MBOAT superfamily)